MTALVIGATGLVGSELVAQLLQDERFKKIKIFTRRSLNKQHPKLEEHVIDFKYPQQWKSLVYGDVLFSSLGTTLKQAGSKGAQFKIDYTYQYQFAKAAFENGVKQYVLVSAAYASPNSGIFYSRMKGILEKDVEKLLFENITILRPGMLTGKRKEERPGEKFGTPILNLLHRIPGLKSLKPISAFTVSKAMINAVAYHPERVNQYSLLEVFKLAEMPAIQIN
jgi:uncharacterized protein YbjT (DUF2867 family)